MMACTVDMALGSTLGGFKSLFRIHFSFMGRIVLRLGWGHQGLVVGACTGEGLEGDEGVWEQAGGEE